MSIINKYNIKCTSKCMCFSAETGLKCHSMGRDEFWHELLLMIVRHMYEGRPTPYGPMDSIPQVEENSGTTERKKSLRYFSVKR